jgi:hypothetical protein
VSPLTVPGEGEKTARPHISSHEFIAVYRSKELTPEDTPRFLDEYEAKMRQYRGSWRIFLRERL